MASQIWVPEQLRPGCRWRPGSLIGKQGRYWASAATRMKRVEPPSGSIPSMISAPASTFGCVLGRTPGDCQAL